MSIIKTALPIVEATKVEALQPMPEVMAALKKAVSASGTMLSQCKQAAKQAAKQLNPTMPLADRIDSVMIAYKATIGDNNNVRSNFKDALTLMACAQAPITIESRKGEEVHTTGEDALKLNKHDMKAAVKAVRADNGIGRKTAERSPKTPTAGPVDAVNHESVMRIVASNLFAADDAFIKALVKTCADNGWTLKATK